MLGHASLTYHFVSCVADGSQAGSHYGYHQLGGYDLIGIRVAEEAEGEANLASDGLDYGSALDRMADWATEFKES